MSLNVLIGGERFGVLRDAFIARGHNAVSVDLVEDQSGVPDASHLQGDYLEIQNLQGIHLAIFHPTCTFMANSATKHLYQQGKKHKGLDEQRWLQMGRHAWSMWNHIDTCPVPFAAWENPVMTGFAKLMIGEPQQKVQPWWFGTEMGGPDDIKKATCWWTKNLPDLAPTGTLDGRTARPDVHTASPGPDRAMQRSRTPQGMADAIADQWGEYVMSKVFG